MGRGLSELQKDILRLAYVNQHSPEVNPADLNLKRRADVLYPEILHACYGFEPVVRWWAGRELSVKESFLFGGQIFDRHAIGVDRYNRAQAAVSRAVLRLAERGLIQCVQGAYAKWTGADLTAEGVKVVEGSWQASPAVF